MGFFITQERKVMLKNSALAMSLAVAMSTITPPMASAMAPAWEYRAGRGTGYQPKHRANKAVKAKRKAQKAARRGSRK